jgi:NAD(P)H-dependent FMN reductase
MPAQDAEAHGAGMTPPPFMYGGAGGTRAVEHLRLVMGGLMVADVRAQVALSRYTDLENFSVFKPAPHHEKSVHDVLDQVIAWGGALRSLREQ